MTDWVSLSVQVALTVVGAVVADRVQNLRERQFLVGLLFGALSAFTQVFPIAEIGYYNISVAMQVAAPIVAGFFFGTVAGLVSGGLGSLMCVLSVFNGASALLVACTAAGTVAATLYAVVLGKWVFGDRRPPVCTAVIAAAYGVIISLAVGALFGLDDLPSTVELVLSSFVPMTVGVCLAVGLASVACLGIGSARRSLSLGGFFSATNLAFIFVGLAVTVTSSIIALNAKEEGESVVRYAVTDLVEEEESQARYMLHESAVNIVEAMSEAKRPPMRSELSQYATMFGVDGISVADSNGLVVVTTENSPGPGQLIERDPAVLRRYLGLCVGAGQTNRSEAGFVCLPYLPDGAQTNDWVKHFAYPLPSGGFMRLAYLWSKFQVKFPQYILPTLEGRHIGETGFYLIFNERGLTDLPVPDRPETKGQSFAQIGLDERALAQPFETVFYARILGTLCRCVAFEPFGGYRLFAVLPLAETLGPALVISTIIALVLMAICIVFRLVLVRFQLAQAKIDALRAEEERLRAADLSLAREIQRAELRTDGTEGDGYRLAALMNAAREVGGDFYDYYELPDGRLVVTIADVSGKGVPAAFFMMKSRLTLKSCIYSSSALAEAVAKANVRLSQHNPAEMFVTAWVGVYDRTTGVLEFVSAGHNPPLLRRAAADAYRGADATTWLQAPRSPAMGSFEDARYRSAQVTLAAGDRLFLYTDGVNEAMNVRGELFGNDRLYATVDQTDGALIESVLAAVRKFATGAEQADDITMLELLICGRVGQ